MKIETKNPPREFKVGIKKDITLKDCAHIELLADEQITLRTDLGAEFDIARKDWGYYATPSLDGRLQKFGLRGCLIESEQKHFLLLVERGKEEKFFDYVKAHNQKIICWLDSPQAFEDLKSVLKARS